MHEAALSKREQWLQHLLQHRPHQFQARRREKGEGVKGGGKDNVKTSSDKEALYPNSMMVWCTSQVHQRSHDDSCRIWLGI